MSMNFEKCAGKGNEFVGLVAEELEVSRNKAGRIIRAVLHALRNRLTHEESFQLLAQLPMALKGLYVEGWMYNKPCRRIRHLHEFFEEVRLEDAGLAGYNFTDMGITKVAVTAVFKQLNFVLSGREMQNIKAVMPVEIRKLIKEITSGEGIIF